MSFKYKKPELKVLNDDSMLFCNNGTSAQAVGPSYQCISGTSVNPVLCTDGSTNDGVFVQCDSGGSAFGFACAVGGTD